MILKKFWKEFLLVLILGVLLSWGLDFGAELVLGPSPTIEAVYSPVIIVISMLIFAIPLIAAIPGGYLIRKKGGKLKAWLLLPAFAVLLAGVVIVGYSLVLISVASAEDLGKGLEKAKEFDVAGMFAEMSAEDFRAFTITAGILGMIFMGILNFGFGIVGALIGKLLVKNRAK